MFDIDDFKRKIHFLSFDETLNLITVYVIGILGGILIHSSSLPEVHKSTIDQP